MAETEYNVEKLHEINKNKLIDVLSQNNVQPQYHGDISSNKSTETKQHPIIKWIIDYLFDGTCLLGTQHWYVWQYQTGEWLDRSIMYNFGFTRYIDGVKLNDTEYIDLANLADITRMSYNNYYDLSNVISGSKTNILGFTALRTNLIYVAKNLSANIIKGIAKYNLLLRPFCNTWLVNMKIDNEDDCYYWWRPAKGYYNKHQSGGSSMKNGRVMACKWLSLKDISKLR